MNKKIKIIELLNKIANGEKVPIEIKFRNIIYVFNKECNQYYERGKGSYFNNKLKFDKTIEWEFFGDYLNEEVEILDDEILNEPEEIEELEVGDTLNYKSTRNKINELVRKINYIERKLNEN